MRILERYLALTLATLCASAASAHGGAGANSACALRLGAWRLEAALYQPATRDGEMFCDALPAPGPTVLLFDVVDAALATMPLEVRIVRAGRDTAGVMSSAWDTPALAAATVAHLPASIHPGGTVALRHEFVAAGAYLALLRAPSPGGGEWRTAFRFTVGTVATRMQQAATLMLGVLAAFALLTFARRRNALASTDTDKHDDNTRISA